MLLPAWKRGEEPDGVRPRARRGRGGRVRAPADELVDRLNYWLQTWAWRRTARDGSARGTGRRPRAGARGDAAGAAATRALLHPDTARAMRLELHAAQQSTPELAAQVRARAVPMYPTSELCEPELTLHLARFWFEHRGERAAPGSGEQANEFIRFVTACAVAIGLHAPFDTAAARWRIRWQRELARIAEGLSKGRTARQ